MSFDSMRIERLQPAWATGAAVYEFTIARDGTGLFRGSENVAHLGEKRLVVSPAAVMETSRRIQPFLEEKISDHYGIPIMHMPTVRLTIVHAGRTKVVTLAMYRDSTPPFDEVGKPLPDEERDFWIFAYDAIAEVERCCGIDSLVDARGTAELPRR